MSVKVHEPVCLDSAQDLYFWFDHFLGDQLKDEWDSTIAGAGAVAVVDAQMGGIVRLTTGALTGNNTTIDWNDIRSLLVTKKVTMEVRAKLSSTTQMRVLLELRFDANNRINISVWGGATWNIETYDGGAATGPTSGVNIDTDYHIFRIECFPTGEVHFYIDGVETANSPITTNIPDDATDYLQPYLYVGTGEDVAKSVDIDYVVVRQDR